MIPKYHMIEYPNGDVDVCFDERVLQKFHDFIFEKIKKKVTKLEKDEKTLFHLEQIVDKILKDLDAKGKIKKNKDDVFVIKK